jgi:hypothetical protein
MTDYRIELELDKKHAKELIERLMQKDLLDEDGYPTDHALLIVKHWHWSDPKGWFEFIESIWHLASWGWEEKTEKHELFDERDVHRYYVSTAGWSGNESIIKAMQQNKMMWHLNWVQSRRGGHYIFELKEISDA